MNNEMPKLPYANNALEPVISESTINYHYGKHLQTYVTNLGKLTQGTKYESMTVEDIVKDAPKGGIHNNAGQVLNHTLYFLQFKPKDGLKENIPTGKLLAAIEKDFGSFENLKNEMNTAAAALFGSGWLWLAEDNAGKLLLVSCANGDTPLQTGLKPVLGFDVWEHAYYLDYQNRRVDYLKELWQIIDWTVVEGRI